MRLAGRNLVVSPKRAIKIGVLVVSQLVGPSVRSLPYRAISKPGAKPPVKAAKTALGSRGDTDFVQLNRQLKSYLLSKDFI